jgi:hypothetical protein
MSVALHFLGGGRSARAADRWARRHLRRSLAASYETALREAVDRRYLLTARVPVRREEVVAASADIEALIARLRDLDRPIDADAVRLARDLMCDGEGPLYMWAEPGTLRRRVRVICEAMG